MWKGEFEVERKLGRTNDQEQKLNSILGISPRGEQTNQNVLAKKLPEIMDLPFSHRLSILGPGCLLGDDDILSKV